MKFGKLVILLLTVVFSVAGCKKDDSTTETTTHYYEPQVPWGNIDLNHLSVVNVTGLAGDVSTLEKIKLTWRVPPLYTTLNYKIVIFKAKKGTAWELPDPSSEVSGADFYKLAELQGNEYLDQNVINEDGTKTSNVAPDTDYSYWVYIKINDTNWSTGVRLNLHSKAIGSSFNVPKASTFWDNKYNTVGYWFTVSGGGEPPVSLTNISPGLPEVGKPRGGISFAYSGNAMYVADTGNNRVLIYTRPGALNCDSYEDEYYKQACLFQFTSQPMTAINILGQENKEQSKSCQMYEDICSIKTTQSTCTAASTICSWTPNTLSGGGGKCSGAQKCLQAPSKVSVIDGRLFISDSGNNRVVVYNHLPVDKGCDPNPDYVSTKPVDCSPDWVIGKAGLADRTNYSFTTSSEAILNYPTDVVASGDKLFVADTGNNRVVTINNYTSRDSYNCISDTWGGGICKFSGVIGQPNLFTNDYFANMVSLNPSILTGTLSNNLADGFQSLLKRYLRSPVRIKIVDDKMFIAGNEQFLINNNTGQKVSLQARVLVYDLTKFTGVTPSCSEATFESGNCDAVDVIGQQLFTSLPVLGNDSSGSYDQLSYGLYRLDDFDMIKMASDIEGQPDKLLMLGVNYLSNYVYIWEDVSTKTVDGYPYNGKALDPEARFVPATQQSLPDLKAICAIRIVDDTSNIYITDCMDHHVQEVRQMKLMTQ